MPTPPIKIPVLHHINLKTTRLQEMIDWYGTVIGCTPMHQFPGGAWLTNDAANHRIALLTAPRIKDDPERILHTGMHHSAFEYASLDDLLDSFERLDGLGIRPHMMLDHGLTTSFYYLDPDGNSVELQCDNFGDWAASSDWIRTSPDFAANPIGAPVDPQQMLAARKAGASTEELHRRAYAGEFPPGQPMDFRFPMDP
ncbi:glyoxalase/bleomycin resistance protein/dioxygenase superfamily protein [Humitalea rosea]|uniref:Glyoxalase/bleomycin resistance protein/dioxygenase superfamily protein n=1 Tax=Humitalea rosea TaxID=990373 RepID=A0A2W7JBU3_9PROT|nr:VOC family protein [Humitalea rosea]PZW49171.1 glyoxalase/bleomycin resistance protein/dioxygenase superfamily protein [Humitalea rosea]